MFDTEGLFPPRLIEESAKVCDSIGQILGLNLDTAQVKTYQIDSSRPFADKQEEYRNRTGRHNAIEEASINALSFICPKGSEQNPVALQIGRYYELFKACGRHIPSSSDYEYGKHYMNVPQSIYLANGLGKWGYLSEDYLKTMVPLVGEKIHNHDSVIGSIYGRPGALQKNIYEGLGARPDTLNVFLDRNPAIFSNTSNITDYYG